jgi:ABC-type enterochelin transport system permease subunit
MTIGLSFAIPCDPQSMFVIIFTIIIKNWKQGKEKEKLTWSCYLKTKAMVMEGWLTNVTFFPSTSVFRSLHLCSCFSLLVFSLFIFLFLLFPLSLSVLVPLGLSLYYLC